jgi:hypothetical protein
MRGGTVFAPPTDINRVFANNPGDLNFIDLLKIENIP